MERQSLKPGIKQIILQSIIDIVWFDAIILLIVVPIFHKSIADLYSSEWTLLIFLPIFIAIINVWQNSKIIISIDKTENSAQIFGGLKKLLTAKGYKIKIDEKDKLTFVYKAKWKILVDYKNGLIEVEKTDNQIKISAGKLIMYFIEQEIKSISDNQK